MPVLVADRTVDDGATAGVDHVPVAGRLALPVGETLTSVTVAAAVFVFGVVNFGLADAWRPIAKALVRRVAPTTARIRRRIRSSSMLATVRSASSN